MSLYISDNGMGDRPAPRYANWCLSALLYALVKKINKQHRFLNSLNLLLYNISRDTRKVSATFVPCRFTKRILTPPSLSLLMEIDKPNLGVSAYDYKYKGYRCAYCNEVVITNDPETLELLFQDAVAKLRLEDAGGANEFFLTEKEEAVLRETIATRERGVCIAYEQCIHYRCLALLQQPDNKETFSRLLLANRQNLVLPDENPALYTFYELNYSGVRQCLNACVYCQREIDANSPGFAYCEKCDVKRRCLFLHNACYLLLKEQRYREQLLAANARRNFSHFLTSGPLPVQCVEEMAARNEAWLSFAKRYELTFDERHALKK